MQTQPHQENAAAGVSRINGQAPASSAPPDKAAADLEITRQRLLSAVGQVLLALMNVPRYKHHTLSDLERLILDPLMQDRIAIASTKAEGAPGALVGLAFWASVSPDVDAKIKEQIKAGVFPIRLKPEEWNSGDKVWLLDLIAPNRKLSTSVLLNFRQVAANRQVSLHPVVSSTVDPEVLKQLAQSAQATAG